MIDTLSEATGNATVAKDTELLPVSRALFTQDFLIDFDLYVQSVNGYVLYWAKGGTGAEKISARLKESQINTVFIAKPDQKNYNRYVEHCLPIILADKSRPVEERTQLLRSCSVNLMKQVMEHPRNAASLNLARVLSEKLVDQVIEHPEIFFKMAKLTSHHYSTYAHSVDVCIYSVALGQFLGRFTKSQLLALGLGAMMHDVGKTKIATAVLDRNGPLTESEWYLVRQHPTWSYEIVRDCLSVPELARLAIIEHHERCDGKGYPKGLRRERINPVGRIMMIADVYAALITKRAYHEAADPYAAVKTMAIEMNGFFDRDILRQFILLLGNTDTPERSSNYARLAA